MIHKKSNSFILSLINITIYTVCYFLMFSCNSSKELNTKASALYKILSTSGEETEGYISNNGDTIVPLGKYVFCFSDTITDFGKVMNPQGKILGINVNAVELFEIFKYDNGPDYVSDGLFRIIKDGKIGYAAEDGNIIIEPRFDCAYPFENGKAKVSELCSTIQDGEHSSWESEQWYFISKDGTKVD